MTRYNPIEPIPLAKNEIALMTRKEFLDYRNPQGKMHPDDAYDFDLADLNQNYKLRHVGDSRTSEGNFSVIQCDGNYLINYSEGYRGEAKLVALIIDGTLYYSRAALRHRLPNGYIDDRQGQWVKLDIKNKKHIKYLEEYLPQIYDIKKENLEKYPYLFKRLVVDDESYEIRMKNKPTLNKGDTIVIINEQGQVVATAADEWGATLLATAQEYRGRGFGKLLGELWYKFNPEYNSGGFTPAGKANAIAMWEKRVRQFLANGSYSDLIRRGLLTKARYKEITSGLSKRVERPKAPKRIVEKKPPLVMIEKEGDMYGPAFVIYDEEFFKEPSERYIYGFGFFRDASNKVFLYTIDYDRPYAKLTTYVALQIARNNKEKIWIGQGYGDLLELEGLAHVEIRDDHASLTQDVLDLDLLRRYETMIRRQNDRFDEKYNLLLEMAHTKWGIGQ